MQKGEVEGLQEMVRSRREPAAASAACPAAASQPAQPASQQCSKQEGASKLGSSQLTPARALTSSTTRRMEVEVTLCTVVVVVSAARPTHSTGSFTPATGLATTPAM